jgi:hypothetical protein
MGPMGHMLPESRGPVLHIRNVAEATINPGLRQIWRTRKTAPQKLRLN